MSYSNPLMSWLLLKSLRGLRIGAAYDITMSELQRYSDGSIEVMLMYCFGEAAKPATFVNPRYF